MGFLKKGDKPTRAERKAQRKAEQAVIKAAELDARELAKEEKRAAKAARSRWGRKKRDAAGENEETHEPGEFGFSTPLPNFDLTPDHAHDQGRASDIGAFAPADVAPDNDRDEFLLEDRVTELSQGSHRADAPPLPGMGSLDPVEQQVVHQPDDEDEGPRRRRGFGLRKSKKKAEPDLVQEPSAPSSAGKGTQIRPVSLSQAPATVAPSPLGTQGSAQESFATLRRAVGDPNDVLVLDDPIVEPGNSATTAPPRNSVEPLRLDAQRSPALAGGFSENWLGLWVSEDGAAIFIEDDDGWFAVTVLPDPKTTCYAGPDYPEIQSYRMPASYSREELGEFDGERLSVITVPGLPEGHRSPMMHIYFLASIAAAQGGGNRFATPDDPTRRVFIVADLELGTVNPWSNDDDIEWIDPSVNYYKAPGKLDAYMMRRMSKDDPLN